MKFEKINYVNGKKGILIGFVIAFILVIVINLFFTRAKYKLVESRKLATGTINYTLVDFELVEIRVKGLSDSDYQVVNEIQDGNYVINEEKSYCTEKYTKEDNSFEDVKNESLTINFDKESKTISVSPYSKKGTKCHLYFEESLPPLCEEGDTTCKTLLGNATINASCPEASADGVDKIPGVESTNAMICKGNDDFGTSYYYRGKESGTNNWVVFGQEGSNYIWWRIIRINGNGTIRLIYAGTSSSNKTAPSPTGVDTMITPRTPAVSSDPKSVRFNTNDDDNKYVGYMYGGANGVASTSYDTAHKSDVQSRVLQEIVYWYENKTNLGDLSTKIDVDTGFCGDRTYTTNPHGSTYSGTENLGYGSTATVYGAEKVWQANSTSYNTDEQTATFKCGVDLSTKEVKTEAQKRDLYTDPSATSGWTNGSNGKVEGNNALPVPVGLITMDEVIHAGGFYGTANNGYWLYTNQYYWTMSPSHFSGSDARVFYVYDSGLLGYGFVNNYNGVRPVINLKADTTFTFDNDKPAGTTTNPYVVQTS